jgi:hypothetical protein
LKQRDEVDHAPTSHSIPANPSKATTNTTIKKSKMADSTPKSYSSDPALYLYTSLTSGSSHIVTATSRMETILKANRIPFKALDIATDEKARMLWGRRSGKDEGGRARKIPGLVQMGLVIGVCLLPRFSGHWLIVKGSRGG